jgi:hypothetical protein
MVEEKKKGIFSMLFGKKNSCCCDMKIEEVAEEEKKEPEGKSKAQPASSCCDMRPKISH